MSATVYFASDSHFGAGSPASQALRCDRFVAWLDSFAADSTLYLLGDIFDFWLDYPNFMPKSNLDVLYGLRRTLDRGIDVHFVGGNHDIWCADYLRNSLGVNVLASHSVVEHQGKRLRLTHGDGLLGGDQFYKVFRALVRNPALVFVAKSIHPELLHRFAFALSKASREKHQTDVEALKKRIRLYGEATSHADVDYLITGHIHCPIQVPFDGWTFTCLGDWVSSFTAGQLQDGVLELVDVTGRESIRS